MQVSNLISGASRPGVLLNPRADQERRPATLQDRYAGRELARAVVSEDTEEPREALRDVSVSTYISRYAAGETYCLPLFGRLAVRLALGEEPAMDQWPCTLALRNVLGR